MPTRNCTTPRTPLPTSLLSRTIRSISFSFHRCLSCTELLPLCLLFRLLLSYVSSFPSLSRSCFLVSLFATMLLFPSLESPSYRLRISPPDLTYPWGITPLQFVLYGAAPANRRATESIPAIYEPEPATTDTLESKNSAPSRVSSLSFPPLPPPVRESNSARVSREVMRASLKAR